MNITFFSVTGLCRKQFSRDVTQFISLLESDERAEENQLLEATMQMEELKCQQERLKQDVANAKSVYEEITLLNESNDLIKKLQ